MRYDLRLIDLEGAYNFRHVGGYPTQQGTFVEWGNIYRSGEICNLTQKDIEQLEYLEIKTIIDFRNTIEKNNCPDAVIATVKNRVALPIDAGSMVHNMQKHSDLHDGREIVKEVNRILVRHSTDVYAEFFKVCSDKKNLPILFHCSAGKDRTGLAAALLLSALGVDRQTIITDYCLSATYLLGKAGFSLDDQAMNPILTVTSDYLEAAFEVIDNEFGGMESYLKETLHADTELLKSMYTE
jgi:protein-tyrosine phosphatase